MSFWAVDCLTSIRLKMKGRAPFSRLVDVPVFTDSIPLAWQAGQSPVQHVGRRFFTNLRTDSHRFAITPIDRTSPSSSATATAIVSAWTSKPTNFILFTDRLLSLVALRFGLTDSQRNPRAANRSRSFHGDNRAAQTLLQIAAL